MGAVGAVGAPGVTVLYEQGIATGAVYLMLVSSGINLVYGISGFILYERLVAALRHKGTTAFLIFVSDILGQAAACAIIAFREFDPDQTEKEDLAFFLHISYVAAGSSASLVLASGIYFVWKMNEEEEDRGRSRSPDGRADESNLPQCRECGNRFSNVTALRIHIRDTHLAVPAWHGQPTQVKVSILRLASDPRNLTRRLSGTVTAHAYDHALYTEMSRLTLQGQAQLQKMFDYCVPNKVSAAVFWWSYFTRVRRIKTSFANRPNARYGTPCRSYGTARHGCAARAGRANAEAEAEVEVE